MRTAGILILGLLACFWAQSAMAQLYVHDSGWTVGSAPQQPLQPGEPPKTIEPAPPAQDPTVDEAWSQVWSPIEGFSGWKRSSAETIIGNAKDTAREDSGELMSNARAWGVIFADLGIFRFFRELVADWFVFTATETPQRVAQ